MKNRHSVSSSKDLKLLSSQISFSGFWNAERHFVSWLGKMEALHEPIWRKAGIFEAIKASAYNIVKNQSLILSVAQNWCSITKSFIFPWGEATITLEDVMVLLGFSVLGSPVFVPLESSEMRDSVRKMEEVRQECIKTTRDGRVSQPLWTSSFFGRGGQMEHEAFLVLWLSLFVFPAISRRGISRHVMPIAVRLARGERIALAPAVLASIYRDLGQIRDLVRGGMCDGDKVNLKSLLKLVQVWTWERFQSVRPKARIIPKGEPRIAQWDAVQQRSNNVRLSFDDFEWRPYTKLLKNWSPFRFYVEEAMWVTVDDTLDDEFKSYARCVRVSQLVGDGFVEGYYPSRVARQFGLTQDLPDLVNHRRHFTEKEAWEHYSRSLADLKVYMPSRLDRGSVTSRYQDLWLKSVSEFLSSEEATKESTEDTVDCYDDDDLDISPKVLPLSKVVQKLEEGFPAKLRRSRTCRLAKKYKEQACEDDEEGDSMTIAQRVRSRKKYFSDAEETGGDDCKSFGKRRRKFQVEDSEDSDHSPQFSSVKVEQRSKEYEEVSSKSLETRQLCDDDEVDVSVNNAEKKKTMDDDGNKEAEYLHNGYVEKERSNDDYDERWKQRKLAIEELALNLEARMDKMLKTLAIIREWKTKRNQIQSEV